MNDCTWHPSEEYSKFIIHNPISTLQCIFFANADFFVHARDDERVTTACRNETERKERKMCIIIVAICHHNNHNDNITTMLHPAREHATECLGKFVRRLIIKWHHIS